MVCQEIKDFLAAHADARYAAFVTSLMPGARPVVGVRLPVLRALAKEIAKGDWRTYLEEAVDDTFEEVMLQGYVTGAARMPFEEQIDRMTAYVRKINDWALCDSPCSGFKFVRKHREEVWAFLQPYLYSGEVFSQRFAVVMLLAHFVTDDFIDRVLEACAAVRPSGYYASMAVAWAVSVCFAKYPEKNIEALLRTHIQRSENSHFIFAGSERHMMQEMFASAARPFYHSADMLELKAIPAEIYIPFIVGHFERRNRSIAAVDVEKVYALFQGHTYYIQKTFNESFADTPEGDECTLETIRAAIDNMIASNDTIFREILSNVPEKQKELLYAIAREGEAERITSADFIKRHSLTSASSVQSAAKKLLEKDLITEINKVFSVTDRLFAMWINKLYGKNPDF